MQRGSDGPAIGPVHAAKMEEKNLHDL